MVARVAIFEGVKIAKVHESAAEAEAVIKPMVEALDGYRGRLDLAAPDGRFISITLFDSEEQAGSAEPTFDEEMPRRLGEMFASWEGSRVSTDLFEVTTNTF